jgi:hypothetical protein
MVINESPRVVGNKGKTQFVCLSGDVQNVINDKLNKNWSKVNPNSSSTETMRVAIQSLIVNREFLIGLARGLDASTLEITDGGGAHHQGHTHKGHPHQHSCQDGQKQALQSDG